MPQLKGLPLFCLFSMTLCFLFSTGPLLGQPSNSQATQANGDQTTQALLNEVHELRLALQQNNLHAYRAQIYLERLREQQRRVNDLRGELNGIREQAAEIKSEQPHFNEMIKSIEGQMEKEQNPTRRTEMEMQVRMLKSQVERQGEREQRQRERETQLTSQLQVEDAKLSELGDRLDAIERDLEKQLSTDKPQPGGKRP